MFSVRGGWAGDGGRRFSKKLNPPAAGWLRGWKTLRSQGACGVAKKRFSTPAAGSRA